MKAILTYHSVDDSGSVISITEAGLESHLDLFEKHAIPIVPAAEIDRAPDPALALTFDDGFVNFAERAWPRIRDRGFPVTLFVVTDFAGRTNRFGGPHAGAIPELDLLDWDELAALADEGVEIGSHTATHPDLTRVDSSRLETELGRSAGAIEARLGQRPRIVAYPFGFANGRVRDAAHGLYDAGVTTRLWWVRSGEDPLLLPRLDAYYWRHPRALRGYGTGRFRAAVTMRAAARRARAFLGGGTCGIVRSGSSS